MELLIWERMLFFFLSYEKVAFFSQFFSKAAAAAVKQIPFSCLHWWGSKMRARGWGPIRFPCISLQCSHAGESRNDSEVKHCHGENISLACKWKLTTPGACKCIFVLKELVSRGLSQLWGAVRGGCWRGKGGL